MKKSIVVFLLLAALLASACLLFFFAPRPRGSVAVDPAVPVGAGIAPGSGSAPSADVRGVFERVPVLPRLSGHAVAKINVSVGDKVREGQVLAELDEAPLAVDLSRRRDALAQAEKNYREAVVSGDRETDRLKEALDRARGDLADIQTKMGYRYVIAPADGVVLERNVSPGGGSRADTVMFVIGRPVMPRSGDAARASGD